jgi:GNAT superfamily N-acetyltransferase
VSGGALVQESVRLDDPTVTAFTAASISEMDERHGGDPGSGAPPRTEDFLPPEGAFLLARLDGQPSGCGGFSRFDDTTAEIRRMYVVPEARGRDVGKALVTWLLEAARDAGYSRVRLETGNRQNEALGLYRSAGFSRIPCWGPYADDPKSRCFELDISRGPTPPDPR